ncbi:hypothetical protein C5167_020792 [Papaver somniferum]|uniref:Uncharacterized protein n=1 Tax=Papaver somniferum TaxID=3469 RepID=A0A4Y7IW30_PAPSO|nr:hypothetical protein C5167_020792 [Papaver somniferum]
MELTIEEEKVEVEDIVAESILDIVHDKYAHYKKTELDINEKMRVILVVSVGDEEGPKEIAPGKMKVQFSCRCILERK